MLIMASKTPTTARPNLNYNDQLNTFVNFSSIHSVVNEVMHFISALFRKYTKVSLQDISIYQWILLFVCVWIVLHIVLFKLTKTFLRQVGVDEMKSKLLSQSVWDFCFALMSSYMVVESLHLDVVKFSQDALNIMDKKSKECFVMDRNNIARSEVLYVIITAYFIHMTSWGLFLQGFRNVEVLQKEVITLFFILTRALRCTEFGMMVLFFLHSFCILEEFTKLVCVLGLICNSSVLRKFAKCCYVVQLIYWCRMYLYQSPKMVMLMYVSKIDSTMIQAELNLLLLIPSSLSLNYILTLYNSSANRLLWHFFRPSGNASSTFEYLVFGQLDDTLDNGKMSRQSSSKKKKKSEEEERKIQNKVALYQTVRCYMVLKRKLKRIREKREGTTVAEN